ncbi:putative NADH-dependent dehydrogenase [Thermogutta terrifontis]|uniref:Putative NADH-dependent dehydrogenase n=1 Tax=Thermogutta terrifontis TaxID=1331910 RepID=A0A286RMA0_9BACT|nr:Gfo/Idh/MocA family oxidoreductase [Thermogutta terrifontis]ASV77092.1 putative NADH-dependent dehydrogenase [Thermogutta terrifontis]
MLHHKLNRRQVLGGLLSSLALPTFVKASALGLAGLSPASERVTLGLIGCGGHGVGWNLAQVFRHKDAQVIAVCDVDQRHLAAGKERVDKFYGELLGTEYKECAVYGDFRDLINRRDIVAIMNCTPDHWHVLPAMMASMAGKDVLCEKPLTLFVEEGQVLCRTVAEHKTVFQTASENRSIDVYIRLISLVRAGVIGKLQHIEVRLPIGNTNMRVVGEAKETFGKDTIEEPPPYLNYEMWLGQAPWMPYIAARVHGNFRWNLAFSGGVLTDWGAHMIDLAQWGHNTEHTGPVEVEGRGDFPPRDAVYNTAPTFDLHYRYADGVTMRVSAGTGDLDPAKADRSTPLVGRTSSPGIRFEGTDGWIESHNWRGALRASRREFLDVDVDPKALGLYVPSEVVKREDGGKGGEHRNFLDCIKTRQPCYAPAEIGHRTITIAHIGNIAMMLGRKLRWNPAEERFVDDEEANGMLTRKQREPWTMKNVASWIK